MRPVAWCAALGALACRSQAGIAPPPTPRAAAPLRIQVVYPRPTDVVAAVDSTFIFGNVGRGDATLQVAGTAVPVQADGAWIAWIPLPDDTAFTVPLTAVAAGESLHVDWPVRIAPRFHPPVDRAAWIDTTSFSPAGSFTWPAGEGVHLRVRATPGAVVRLSTPSGTVIPFVPDRSPAAPPAAVRAFGTDSLQYHAAPDSDRYEAWLPAEPLDRSAVLEVSAGDDTARATWPVVLGVLAVQPPTVVVLDDDSAGTGTTDSLTTGRAVPWGTYHWFFPTGTRAVETGRWNDQVRLALSGRSVAWVNAADVHRLPAGTPPPAGPVGSVRLTAGPGSVTLRVPLPARLPFRVEEGDRSLTLRLYGGRSDINWMQYGGTDSLVTRLDYLQESADELTITVSLARRVWGYRTRFDGRDLLLEIRRPPVIDSRHPLRGRTIVLDPGHPPAGATGPTGLWEPVATLAVALKARTLLVRAGALVLLTRGDMHPVELYPRTRFAEQHDADVLVSIHANALPDGINPFENNGTSVYYFQPRSADLARALDRALVAALGLRDLGMGRGDYALARPTWMPAALTEGLFIMMPDQERVLADDAGQWRYARAVVAGIAAFLRQRAGDP
jgi:N-acetylmuramoyl-L-alanine amidase